MKRILFAGLLFAGVTLTVADSQLTVPTEAEKSVKQDDAKQRMMEKTGGLLKVDGKGSVVFIDLQKKISTESIGLRATLLAKMLRVEVRTLSADDKSFKLETAAKFLEKTGATAAVLVVDCPELPMSLLALEQNWAAVNVAVLAADNPAADVLQKRVNKELMRMSAILLGTFSSAAKTSPLVPVTKLSDLDALDHDMLTMDSMIAIFRYMSQLGITQTKMTTYKKACMEGWAPAPTNAYQKAIWDHFKAEKERGPAKALQIKP